MHVRADGPGRVLDVRHVRLAVRVQRRRDAEDERVGLRGLAEVDRRRERLFGAGGLRDPLRGNVLDVALAIPNRVDLPLVDVEADDGEALFAEGQRERQAYVAQPADADHGLLREDPLEKSRLFDLKHLPPPTPARPGFTDGSRPGSPPGAPSRSLSSAVASRSTTSSCGTYQRAWKTCSPWPRSSSMNAAQPDPSAAMRRCTTPARW